MKKGVIFVLFAVLLLIIGYLGLSLTGYVVSPPRGSVARPSGGPMVTRHVEENGNFTNVHLNILSDEKILAIRENFPNNSISWYNLSNHNFEIAEFKHSENTWVFADSNHSLDDFEISYRVDSNVNAEGGEYFYFEGDELVSYEIQGDLFECNNLVCISPIVKAGEPTRISIIPPTEGIYSQAYIYRRGIRYKGRLKLCDGRKCNEKLKIEYDLPEEWVNDDYVLRVYDYSESNWRNRWKSFNFSLTNGEEPRDTEIIVGDTNLTFGDSLNIQIKPGNEGVSRYAYIQGKDFYFSNYIGLDCSDYICKEDINLTYEIKNNLINGNYVFRIYDHNELSLNYSSRWKEIPFHVEGIEFKKFNVSINTTKVAPGEKIEINIQPSSLGIPPVVYVVKNKIYMETIKLNCPNYKCFDNQKVSYSIPDYFVSGNYEFLIYDYGESDWKKMRKTFSFEVINGIEPRNLTVELLTNSLRPGDSISIEINAGTEGISNYVTYFKYQDIKTKKIDYKYYKYTRLNCSSYKCYGNYNLKIPIPSNWPEGEYGIRVYDYGESDWRVRNKYFNFIVSKISKFPKNPVRPSQ